MASDLGMLYLFFIFKNESSKSLKIKIKLGSVGEMSRKIRTLDWSVVMTMTPRYLPLKPAAACMQIVLLSERQKSMYL